MHYDHSMSISRCEIWGEVNRCDGALCDVDHECQSGCCGNFISFTHRRCLPSLGDYCAGRDTTRHYEEAQLSRHHNPYANGIVDEEAAANAQLARDLESEEFANAVPHDI